MFDLEKLSKKELRRGKWLTILALFIGVGAISPVQAAASSALTAGLLVAIFVAPKTVLRWILPLALIAATWSFSGVSWLLQIVLTVAVIGARQVLVGHVQAPTKLTTQTKLKINGQGLNKRDLTVFKAVFNRTNDSVTHVEQLLTETNGLRKIAAETEVIRYARGVVKELADDPTQLTDADDFVYTHLPNMEKILMTYHDIISHEMIDESDKQQLAAARDVLRQLADQIQQDYRRITRDDITSLQDQLDTAKRTMRK
ncbi:5-bromo-4-chloroindolyl phosphate hydrolysis family protein [Weissella cibaria]|uniref:5-bromo-4-chloroindolyl phosphate hydrolase n=1 Tax=Weissella cibaria TaxID=137591 RepID=A0A9Q8JJ02_9LACO|nr:5-bromo-4-chloroindolyl phosphate hydrolysis family protein [Weissella cibaria]QDG80358.1 5-bromo-4-chloroindolyl phosphate hydrolase [Weissella cibaria]QMU89455.1 5-bromo-4-chloroindolyl phosphate hydrolysis family protein [Weissella cibaria]TVV27772.1 5-bromo-4-chloroindolyl phosphate hydrolase [Weissella cibaria]TVV35817.1 5-bromo-4-chloroindolyl phosphate hydrolase [Weissella cibaria]TVV40964.1 5-bromo-4-chloroindolyl phosphate hydrolase [Weissella cibaria]